jgi:serine/threonine-protein kinase/endoribonuclease IRE1
VFSLGCLLFYVLTDGRHPFGERLERDSNIAHGRLAQRDMQQLERLLPEAAHLIRRMLSADSHQRYTMEQVLLHPFFWSDSERLLFLKDASDALEFVKPDTPLVLEMESRATAVLRPHTNWREPLDVKFLDNLGTYRKYDFGAMRDLLRVIRNKYQHYRELPDDVQQLLGHPPRDYLDYFLRRFPRLLIETYETIEKMVAHEETFRRYFGRTNHRNVSHQHHQEQESTTTTTTTITTTAASSIATTSSASPRKS